MEIQSTTEISITYCCFSLGLPQNLQEISRNRMQIGPPLVLPLFLSLKGANPDRIDDRGVGWLCGYKGPLQDSWQRGLPSG